MFINSHREAGPSGDFDGEPMSRHLHAWISSLEWPNQGSRSPFPDSQPHVRRDHPSMGKAAPTASPCDAGCDADTDGQIWHTSSPPASPAAVGSRWFAQRNPSPCMASHSCNVAKLDENALTHSPRRGTEDRNAEPALGRMPHLRATLSPVSWWVWLLATPVHPLRDAVDILDDFGFVDIPAASIRSVHMLAWVRLAVRKLRTCSGGRAATDHGPRPGSKLLLEPRCVLAGHGRPIA
jgi:hypothetical protein